MFIFLKGQNWWKNICSHFKQVNLFMLISGVTMLRHKRHDFVIVPQSYVSLSTLVVKNIHSLVMRHLLKKPFFLFCSIYVIIYFVNYAYVV